jgi:hypothetical protein
MDWIHLAQDRNKRPVLVIWVINLRVPQNAGNFLTIGGARSFSRTLMHTTSYMLSHEISGKWLAVQIIGTHFVM